MTKFCETCGTPRVENEAFCANCGIRLDVPRARLPLVKLSIAGIVILGLIALPRLNGELALATATPAMVEMASQGGLNHQGKIMLMSAHPVLTDDIAGKCAADDSASDYVEQGCFVPRSYRIYVRQMPGELAEVQTVALAHEMLHVAYAKLEGSDKTRLDALLEAEVNKPNRPGLTERLAYYEKIEPGQRSNELHSILATEYTGLSAELEKHYAQYFDNRLSSVTANDRVLGKFNNFQARLTAIDGQVAETKLASENHYAAHLRAANSGNAAGADYNYRLYTADMDRWDALVKDYNGILEQFNALADQFNGKKLAELAR